MNAPKAWCLALLFMLCVAPALMAQDEPPLAIRVRQTLGEKEPGWRFVASVESGRIPIVPGERRILTGLWERKRKGAGRETVGVQIYQVENSPEAAKWLNPVRSRQVPAGWRVVRYDVGEEGYLAEYQKGNRFEIHLRTGNVVVRVSGSNLSTVERFVKSVVSQVLAV